MQNRIKNLLFILLLVCFGIAGAQPEVSKPGMVQVHGGTLFWSVVAFLLLFVVLKNNNCAFCLRAFKHGGNVQLTRIAFTEHPYMYYIYAKSH